MGFSIYFSLSAALPALTLALAQGFVCISIVVINAASESTDFNQLHLTTFEDLGNYCCAFFSNSKPKQRN